MGTMICGTIIGLAVWIPVRLIFRVHWISVFFAPTAGIILFIGMMKIRDLIIKLSRFRKWPYKIN